MNLTWIDLLTLIGTYIFIFAIFLTTLHFINKRNNDYYDCCYKLNQHLKRHYYLNPFALELENKWFNRYLEQRYKYFFGGFLDDNSYLDDESKNQDINNLEKENQQLKEKVSELEEKVQGIYTMLGEISVTDCDNKALTEKLKTEKLKQENKKLKTKIKTYKNKIKALDNTKEIKKQRKARGAI